VVIFITLLAGFVPLLQVTFFTLLEDFYPGRLAVKDRDKTHRIAGVILIILVSDSSGFSRRFSTEILLAEIY
jgi:hypothetical protein